MRRSFTCLAGDRLKTKTRDIYRFPIFAAEGARLGQRARTIERQHEGVQYTGVMGQPFDFDEIVRRWQLGYLNSEDLMVTTALAFGKGDNIYAAVAGRILQTPDDGMTLNDLTNNTDFGGDINYIAVDPAGDDIVYLSTGSGRVWRGVGNIWEDIHGNLSLGVSTLPLLHTASQLEPWIFAGSTALFVAQYSRGVWATIVGIKPLCP